jgi:hypothetical protein
MVRREDGILQAVLDLRRLVDAATKSYTALANDVAVKDALDALGRTSKAKLKLGPSARFTSNVNVLERVDQSVITDSVDVCKQSSVFWVDAIFNSKCMNRWSSIPAPAGRRSRPGWRRRSA